MSTSGLKQIAPVPTAADFLDIVLSKTQRKTPTVRPRPAQSMLRV
jgi:nucleolar GTP-binding protein